MYLYAAISSASPVVLQRHPTKTQRDTKQLHREIKQLHRDTKQLQRDTQQLQGGKKLQRDKTTTKGAQNNYIETHNS